MFRKTAQPNVSVLPSPQFVAFGGAILLHLALIAIFIFKPSTNNKDLPVLSFTVTIADFATSAPAAISRAEQASGEKNRKPITQKNNSTSVTEISPEEKPENNSDQLNKGTVNSIQQSTALADSNADFSAAYLNNPAPTYPLLSKQLKEEGSVLLNVLVNENGQAEKITLLKSSGFSRLDNAAIAAVKNWRFSPAVKNQKLQASFVQIPINFILE